MNYLKNSNVMSYIDIKFNELCNDSIIDSSVFMNAKQKQVNELPFMPNVRNIEHFLMYAMLIAYCINNTNIMFVFNTMRQGYYTLDEIYKYFLNTILMKGVTRKLKESIYFDNGSQILICSKHNIEYQLRGRSINILVNLSDACVKTNNKLLSIMVPPLYHSNGIIFSY